MTTPKDPRGSSHDVSVAHDFDDAENDSQDAHDSGESDRAPGAGSTPAPTLSDMLPGRRRSRTLDRASLAAFLRSAVHLPFASGAEALARTVCDLLKVVRPDLAVGVILAHDEGPALRVVSERYSDAPPSSATEPRFDPRDVATSEPRLFPRHEDEWIHRFPPPFEGSSLHVAGAIDRDDGALATAIDRCVVLLVTSLAATRALGDVRGEGAPHHVRALQARIIQSEKLASVGQIAAKVVHELNNPLTAIVSYSDYLTRKLQGAQHDPVDVERLRRIGESAGRILRFSRDLTTYARPNEPLEPIALSDVLERAVVFCEHVVTEHHVQVVTRFDPETPTVEGRRGQLIQVFINLITNACHAIADAHRGEAARIEIETSTSDSGGARVSIGDNGKGISPENVVRIFDPFFTTKQAGRGTGLGLSIVRSIVEEHGGRVWVRSIVGAGTQFVVELAARPRP